jgi:hypothetical protein
MSIATIKARLKTVLEGVAGIGLVYDTLRFLREEKDLPLLVKDNVLNAWFVGRDAIALNDETVNQMYTEQLDQITLHGFYAVKDEVSEPIFDALVDAVLAAMNTDRRPANSGGTYLSSTIERSDPPRVVELDYRHFGPTQALCHHVKIVLPVVQRHL